jgi:putative endonuclease
MWKTAHKRAIGSGYEKKAEELLKAKGYRIIGRNVTFKSGELDLVCEVESGSSTVLVFVEVRMRDPRSFVSPEESVLGSKLRRLRSACRAYLAGYSGKAGEIRIDLISCDGKDMHHREDFFVF